MSKAPDKIYVNPHDPFYVVETNQEETDIEYIRKDALLEWAKGHQEGERQGSYIWSCFQIFIDKLNSL